MIWLLLACTVPPLESHSEVLVADVGAGRIWAVDPQQDGVEERLSPDAGVRPSALLQRGEELWVADFDRGEVVTVRDGVIDRVVRPRGDGDGRLEEPCALASDGDRVAVLGNDSGNVVFVDEGLEQAALGSPVPLRSAHGVALDGGRAWVGRSPTRPGAGLVQEFDLISGDQVGEWGLWPNVQEVTAIHRVDDGLWLVDYMAGRVARYSLDGEQQAVLAEGLDGPVDARPGPDGSVWILDREGLTRIYPDGRIQAFPLDLDFPRSLLVRSAVPSLP